MSKVNSTSLTQKPRTLILKRIPTPEFLEKWYFLFFRNWEYVFSCLLRKVAKGSRIHIFTLILDKHRIIVSVRPKRSNVSTRAPTGCIQTNYRAIPALDFTFKAQSGSYTYQWHCSGYILL